MNISNKPLDSIQQPHEINAEANRNITIATNTRPLKQPEKKSQPTDLQERQVDNNIGSQQLKDGDNYHEKLDSSSSQEPTVQQEQTTQSNGDQIQANKAYQNQTLKKKPTQKKKHEKKAHKNSKQTQKKLKNFCLPQLPTKGKITKGDQIGAGGKGTVCKGKLESQDDETTDIIIKEAKMDLEESLEKETDISQQIIENAKRGLKDENNLVSDYAGLHSVSLQHKINNQHVQRLINGSDGKDSIRKPIDGTEDKRIELYNSDIGYPNDPSQALNLAREFLAAIHSLHQQGIVHGDIKLENIMISYDKNDKCYHCTVIDLGEAGETQKDEISGFSYNHAPECTNGMLLSPAMDIFAAGTVLCELLFGDREITYFDKNSKKQKVNQWVAAFRFNTYSIDKPTKEKYWYKRDKKDRLGNETELLKGLLQEANKKSDGNDLYPPAIYKAIEDLIVNMCAFDPNERPSSQYSLSVLNDITLCVDSINQYEKLKKLNKEGNSSTEDQNLLKELEPLIKKFQDEEQKPMIVGTTSQAIDLITDLNELNEKINESAAEAKIEPSKLNEELSVVSSLLIQFEDKSYGYVSSRIEDLKNKENPTEEEKQELKLLEELQKTNIKEMKKKKEALLALTKMIETREVLIYNLQRDFDIQHKNKELRVKLEQAIKDVQQAIKDKKSPEEIVKASNDYYQQANNEQDSQEQTINEQATSKKTSWRFINAQRKNINSQSKESPKPKINGKSKGIKLHSLKKSIGKIKKGAIKEIKRITQKYHKQNGKGTSLRENIKDSFKEVKKSFTSAYKENRKTS